MSIPEVVINLDIQDLLLIILILPNHYFQSAIMPTVFINEFREMLLLRFAVIILSLGHWVGSDEITDLNDVSSFRFAVLSHQLELL